MTYRKYLDGLRGLSVLLVLAYHSGIEIFSGGFVGVDIFFVISGFLITSIIYKKMLTGEFLFYDFFVGRVLRLCPSLIILFSIVSIFGFIFYDSVMYDRLGKELFFSSFGFANVLYAQGVDYFTNDVGSMPLIHLWSLGVEEQFYFLWPVILLISVKYFSNYILYIILILFSFSLILSVHSVSVNDKASYFLLHYRAFELLIGAALAIFINKHSNFNYNQNSSNFLSLFGFSLIIFSVVSFDGDTVFPSYNALLPCLGVVLIIYFERSDYFLSKLLSNRTLVFFGLISYPLYLFHQPFISFLYFFEYNFNRYYLFFLTLFVCSLSSFAVFKFVESPIRKSSSQRLRIFYFLIVLLISFATYGVIVAKTNGLDSRFKYFNDFSYSVTDAHSSSFHRNFSRGFNVNNGRILFIGDSVLQHYVLPISISLGYSIEEVDTATRGGCVLLRGVDFVDKFSDISCQEISNSLYDLNNMYDTIVISQRWDGYSGSVTNFDIKDNITGWALPIENTINHFSKFANNIILIGSHIQLNSRPLGPSLFLSKEDYALSMKGLFPINMDVIIESKDFFSSFVDKNIQVIHPIDIFCFDSCNFSNDFSYFSDDIHLNTYSTDFVTERLSYLINKQAAVND